MKALVTGASGFIGGHLVDRLQEEGHDVTAFVRETSDTAHLREVEARLAIGDVRDPASVQEACRGQDWVFHTAALVGTYGRWEHFRDVGVKGTQNVIDAAAQCDVSRFIHLSSVAVYGTRPRGAPYTEDTPHDERPERWNHYVREKVWAERRLWKAHDEGKIRATAVRPSVVLGMRDRNALPRVISNLRSPFGALVGDGTNRVPCVVVEELAEAIAGCAANEGTIGRAYNLSGTEPVTQRELFDSCADAAGIRRMRRSVPEWLALRLAAGLENAYLLARRTNEPFTTRIAVVIAGRDYEIDCSRAAAEIGWRGSADYHEALRRSVEWELQRA